jgi:hypothetical protein
MGSEESLREDYVILVMPSKDINHEGSGPKLRRFLEMALEAGAVKIGDCRLGNQYHQGGIEHLLANVEDRAVVHGVFKDEGSLIRILRDLKEADLGLSVVVSGLFDEVEACCKQVGLEKHTTNQSLGRWGRTDRLPPREILEINTMCGHGMVSVGLIEEVIEDVKNGKCTPEEGGERLFKPCMCGIFNTHRAVKLIKRLTERKGETLNINPTP